MTHGNRFFCLASPGARPREPSTCLSAPLEEDLRTICMRSAPLLHMRELRCSGQGQGPQGESVARPSRGWPVRSLEEQTRTTAVRHF